MKYTKIPTNTFQSLQVNAGILLSSFSPGTAAVSNADILGATTGGINFTATPEYADWGEDIDNCPKNTKELKRITDIAATLSGTFVTVNAGLVKRLAGAADIDATDATKIVPRNFLDASADFPDLWFVGDYSELNGETNGGFIAIHMLNTLNTGGFQIQTSDKAKGQFAFEFTAHFSINNVDAVPFEVYVQAGTAEAETETETDTNI